MVLKFLVHFILRGKITMTSKLEIVQEALEKNKSIVIVNTVRRKSVPFDDFISIYVAPRTPMGVYNLDKLSIILDSLIPDTGLLTSKDHFFSSSWGYVEFGTLYFDETYEGGKKRRTLVKLCQNVRIAWAAYEIDLENKHGLSVTPHHVDKDTLLLSRILSIPDFVASAIYHQ